MNVKIGIPCRICGETIEIEVEEIDWNEWESPSRRHVQDIFPYLSADDRELLISGTCGACFAEIFKDD